MATDENRRNRWIVRDRNGNAWGPFGDTAKMRAWIEKTWPGQKQDERRTGEGWDIEALRSPELGD